jgi:hypothetical protein
MTRPRLIRGLRIAWSVVWGIVCVLLIVLWVRSYYVADSVYGHIPWTNFVAGGSELGKVYLLFNAEPRRAWGVVNTPLINEAYVETYRNDPILRRPNRFGLGVSYPPPYTVLHAPLWLLALLSATLAATPWLPWRFSLRTLLIATTLIAVVLGVVVWSSS